MKLKSGLKMLTETDMLVTSVNSYQGNGFPLLLEERGVGCSREWLDIIKEIVDFAERYIKFNPTSVITVYESCRAKTGPGLEEIPQHYRGWEFKIPDEICAKFKIFSKLDLTIKVLNFHRCDDCSYGAGVDPINFDGYGSVGFDEFPALSKKMEDFTSNADKPVFINPVTIEIEGISCNKKLIRNTISSVLIHELNHVIDQYNRLLHNQDTDKKQAAPLYMQANAYSILGDILGGHDHPLFTIFYHLFSTTELNALIAETYVDLQKIGSKRETFKTDLQKISAYEIYQECKELLEEIKDLEKINKSDPEEKEAIVRMFNVLAKWFGESSLRDKLKILSPVPGNKAVTGEQFRIYFIAKTEKRLQGLLNGIGRVASYYYDMHDEKQEPPKIRKK